MASLTGSFIKDTYQSLLKLIDNGNVTSTAKEITDGEGNGTGVSIDTSGNVTATGTIQGSSVTNGTTSIGDLQTNKEDKSEKGAASGYAPLDVNSKVPTANLPDSVLGQVEYKGTWNADTNTPTLPSASGVKGNYYVVSVAGVYETVDYEIGDWIISNGTQWEKVDNSDKVSSVNGATGVVVLDTDDISEGSTNQYYTSDRANSDFDTRLATKDTDNLTEGSNLYYTDERVSANADVTANTAKTGITQAQADAIVANTAKNSYPSADALKLSGIEEGAEVNVQSDWNASSGDALILNKPTTITQQQSDNITANNAKVTRRPIIAGGNTLETNETLTISAGSNVTITEADGTVTIASTGGGGGAVDSVNGETGVVVLDTDDIDEGTTNLYYTDTRVSANTDVAANTAKVGITAQQATDITTNNAKVGITTQQADEIAANTLKTGITTEQADAITANTLKVGVTTQQAADITANNAKVSMVLGTTAGTALAGDTSLLQLGTTSTTALAGDTTTITTQQATDIVTNNEKVGITTQQASDITANNAKISFDSESSTKLGTIAEGAEVNVNADWNATTGDAQILNKPTIPTNNNQLTNGAGYITDGNTGWNNTYGFITDSTTDTLTNKSGSNNQWTNDAGYINEAAQTSHTNAIGNAIDFSARVTLAGGVAEGTSGIIKNLQSIS